MDTRKLRSARDFIELARHKTAENRTELFGNIADLFLDDRARLSDRERALMTGVLRSLIAELESTLRQELSDRLAERGDVPDALKQELSRDGAEITRPILMQSRALRSPELIELVKFRCREHALAVAARPSLTADAGDIGTTAGEDDLIEALLRHADPQLAQAASDYLVAEAERIDRLKLPVLRVADLPVELARRLCWWISAALRTSVSDRYSVNPTLIDSQIEAATLAVVDRDLSGSTMSTLARNLIDRLGADVPVSVELLIRLAEAGRIPALLAALSRFADLPEPIGRRIALLADGECLAILCKASGVDRTEFLELHRALTKSPAGARRLPSDARNSIMTFYDTISKGNARAALNFWRRDPEFVSAIDQVGPAAKDPPTSE